MDRVSKQDTGRVSKPGGSMKAESINSFANHAPKAEWVREFFILGDDYWDSHMLNKKSQEPKMKRFLRDSGLIDKNGQCTDLYTVIREIGRESETAWGILAVNFADNPQFRWYLNNLAVGVVYPRFRVIDMLTAEGVSKGDAASIIRAFERFCELPFGTSLNWGCVEKSGRGIVSLCRTPCSLTDNRVILFALYRFAEKQGEREFSLSRMMKDDGQRGISPARLFGLGFEDMKSILLGLSAKYPAFLNASFTNDLDKISLTEKTSQDVLRLFEET